MEGGGRGGGGGAADMCDRCDGLFLYTITNLVVLSVSASNSVLCVRNGDGLSTIVSACHVLNTTLQSGNSSNCLE